MHVIVATGASVKARLLEQAHHGQEKHAQVAQLLEHKIRAVAQLRSDFRVESPLVRSVIFRLVSLEFHDCNFQAALWHHKAATELTERFKGYGIGGTRASHGNNIYAVAEVWAAAAALQKPTPCGMVDWSGERTASENARGVPQPPGSLFSYDMKWQELHSSVTLPDLRAIFREIQKVTLCMDRLSTLGEGGVEVFETVIYLGAQSSALRAEILNAWVNFNMSCTQNRTEGIVDNLDNLDDLLFSASCLAALLYINIIFMYKASERLTSELLSHESLSHDLPTRPARVMKPATPLMSTCVNGQPLYRLQDLLQRIYRQQSQSTFPLVPEWGHSVNLEIMTWLSFIAGLAEMFEAESQAAGRWSHELIVDATDVGLQSFRNCVGMLGSRVRRDIRDVLRKFLYFGGLMDAYLEKMLGIL